MPKHLPPSGAALYLSGPISHMPGRNAAAFADAEAQLQGLGYCTVNPLRNGLPPSADWQEHMREDIKQLLGTCAALVLLPGFLDSNGAMCELFVAHMLGIPAYLLHELAPQAAPHRATAEAEAAA